MLKLKNWFIPPDIRPRILFFWLKLIFLILDIFLTQAYFSFFFFKIWLNHHDLKIMILFCHLVDFFFLFLMSFILFCELAHELFFFLKSILKGYFIGVDLHFKEPFKITYFHLEYCSFQRIAFQWVSIQSILNNINIPKALASTNQRYSKLLMNLLIESLLF